MPSQNQIEQQMNTYSLIHLDDLVLVIDQASIIGIESVYDIQQTENHDSTFSAQIILKDKVIPVFHIDKNIEPIDEMPSSRHACIILRTRNLLYAITVDSINSMSPGDYSNFNLPDYMLTAVSPVKQVIKTEDSYLGILNTDKLAELLKIDEIDYSPAENREAVVHD